MEIKIKDKILNYGILITSLFIFLIISARSYVQKVDCERNPKSKMHDGKCITEIEIPTQPKFPRIIPTPTITNQKPEYQTINIKYLDTQDQEHFITTINEYDNSLPVRYMNYLLYLEPNSEGKNEIIAFDIEKTAPPTKLIYYIEPEIAEDLFNKSEAILAQRNNPRLEKLQVVDDNLFLFFGGYLADGGIIRLNKNEVSTYPQSFNNPFLEKINGKYYFIEGEGDACWSISTIHKLDSNFKLGNSYTINSECTDGERVLEWDKESDNLPTFSYRAQNIDYYEPAIIEALYNVDLNTMKRTELYNFREEFPDGIYNAGVVQDLKKDKYLVFLSVDGTPIIYNWNTKNLITVKDIFPIDQSLSIPQFSAKMNETDGIICLVQNAYSTTNNNEIYMAFKLDGTLIDKTTTTNYCSNLYPDIGIPSSTDSEDRLNIKLKYLESLELPENIKIEVS